VRKRSYLKSNIQFLAKLTLLKKSEVTKCDQTESDKTRHYGNYAIPECQNCFWNLINQNAV
jgi:hypothetical protein